ncbi:MAG: hypothetical protein RJA76_1668 [Bacteroidota bacterium]|jgi:predicted DNA-binding protein (MmcQ/YjbR family)
MNLSELRDFCLGLPHTEEKLPFDENTLVFYVAGKIFCLTDMDLFQFINLKCDPDRAIELREQYDEITAAWHMNKKHWNSIAMDGRISNPMIKELIMHSYDLVFAGLPKKIKDELSKTD